MSASLQIFILSVLQGLTEFLPVSSSGHLVLAKSCLGLETPQGPILEVILHGGTMVSILVYYRRRLLELARGVVGRDRQAWSAVIGLGLAGVPAVLTFLLVGDQIEAQFSRPGTAAAMLCVTGLALLSLRRAPVGNSEPRPSTALLMGVAQAVALLPGISRSGATLVAGRWLRVEPRRVAETSFLMVLPLIAGAVALHLPDALDPANRGLLPLQALALGFFVAAVVGYAALALLVRLFSGRGFHWFGIYCLAIGVLGLCFARP